MDMNESTIHLQIEKLTERLSKHSFLERCREGLISMSELKEFMLQHGHYSKYFTRYLCAMMANLPKNEHVLELSENLFEELGFEPDSPKPHSIMYKEMLKSFSLSSEKSFANDATKNLINTMFKHCRNTDPAYGLGALCIGAEAIVPALYTSIIEGFRHHQVNESDILFFTLHIECDDGHAETLNRIMLEVAHGSDGKIDKMLEAGDELITARLNFFSAIEESIINKRSVA